MSKKRWLVFAIIVLVTNTLTFVSAPWLWYGIDYWCLNRELEQELPKESLMTDSQELSFFKEDQEIFVGVSFSKERVKGNNDAMKELALYYLVHKDEIEFSYCETRKEFGRHTCAFHPVIKAAK